MHNIFSVIPNKEERLRVARALARIANNLEGVTIQLPQASVVQALKQELENSTFEGSVQIAFARKVAVGLDVSSSSYHFKDNELLLHKILEGKKIYLTSYVNEV